MQYAYTKRLFSSQSVISVCAVPGTQGVTKDFGHWHCISRACKLKCVSAKKDGMLWDKKIPQPQPTQIIASSGRSNRDVQKVMEDVALD